MSNDYFSPAIDFPELDTLEPTQFIQGRDISDLLILDGADNEPALEAPLVDRTGIPTPFTTPLREHALSTNGTSAGDALDPACACLTQALNLMSKLSSTKSPAFTRSSSPNGATATPSTGDSLPQTVVTENKEIIEAVSNMLQCPHPEDVCLLALISMIIFKMLGRYAAAARHQLWEAIEGDDRPGSGDSSREHRQNLSNHHPGDKDLRRLAAQLILGELYRVQQLVKQLSPRLSAHGGKVTCRDGDPTDEKSARGGTRARSPQCDEVTVASLSATTLGQIEVDLRRCLSTVSTDIISLLRQI
jgi:hypothetical protein